MDAPRSANANTSPLGGPPILLTGATGYIGGRLAPRLLKAGFSVRCLVRNARKLDARPWSAEPEIEIRECDLLSESLPEAMRGCRVAYYLVHSMLAHGPEYRDMDRRLALRFASAAQEAGIDRIIYLGGLGEDSDDLSQHLLSRREVEDALRSTGIDVTVLRAAMIIGAGSASFEILRYLVERLPIMVTPKWVSTECQPIAVDDALDYLVQAAQRMDMRDGDFDIGGPDILTYREIMEVMAEARGLPRRLVIPVPVLTPRLSSWWIHLVTPISHRIARPLADGLRNRVVCTHPHAMTPPRFTVRQAIDAALGQVETDTVETSWSDAGVMPGDPDWAGGTVFVDERRLTVNADARAVFAAVQRVGGGQGYYAADWLWRVRGAMDRLVGGPGLRRGRRSADSLAYGDALDFWRVTAIEQDRLLVLRAEMRLPGVAELTFRIEPTSGQACDVVQTARFKPRGLLGLLYWYAVLPLHGVVFRGMLRGIRKEAERMMRSDESRQPA